MKNMIGKGKEKEGRRGECGRVSMQEMRLVKAIVVVESIGGRRWSRVR